MFTSCGLEAVSRHFPDAVCFPSVPLFICVQERALLDSYTKRARVIQTQRSPLVTKTPALSGEGRGATMRDSSIAVRPRRTFGPSFRVRVPLTLLPVCPCIAVTRSLSPLHSPSLFSLSLSMCVPQQQIKRGDLCFLCTGRTGTRHPLPTVNGKTRRAAARAFCCLAATHCRAMHRRGSAAARVRTGTPAAIAQTIARRLRSCQPSLRSLFAPRPPTGQ